MKSILKKVAVAAIAVMSASTAYAVVLPFDVEVPKLTMVAECYSEDGINIRQQPSTTAARMVYDGNKVDLLDIPFCMCAEHAYWSKAPARGSIAVHTFQGKAPIVSEKNGWLELYGIGPKYGNGWVSAKYCKKRAIKPYNLENFRVIEKNGQKFAVVMEITEMLLTLKFYVGKYVNGYLVCPYVYEVSRYNHSENGKIYFDDDCLYFPPTDDESIPNTSEYPQDAIDYIIRKATPLSTPKILFE